MKRKLYDKLLPEPENADLRLSGKVTFQKMKHKKVILTRIECLKSLKCSHLHGIAIPVGEGGDTLLSDSFMLHQRSPPFLLETLCFADVWRLESLFPVKRSRNLLS